MPQNVTWNGVTYAIPLAGELNWASLSTFLIALGTDAAVAQESKQTIRVAVSTPVTIASATDYAVITDLTVPGAVAVTLPAGVAKQIFVIVDGKGDAATNNITITPNGAETIGGASTLVMNKNRQSVIIGYDVSTVDWKLLEYSIPVGGVTPADISLVTPIKGGTGVSNNNAATMTRTGNFDLEVILGAATDVNLGGNLTTASSFTTAGAFATTLTSTASTNVTLPITGTLATLSGAEVLTNKDIDGGTASNAHRITLPKDTIANLTALTRKAGTEVYATDTQLVYFDNGTVLTPFAAQATPVANVRGVEGGGTVTLISSDARVQVFNLNNSETVVLPTTGIAKGDIWTISNANPFQMDIRASDASHIMFSWGAETTLVALIATPVTSTDWAVINKTVLYGRCWGTYSPTVVGNTNGTPTASWRRTSNGDAMDIAIDHLFTGTGSAVLQTYTCPSLGGGTTINLSLFPAVGSAPVGSGLLFSNTGGGVFIAAPIIIDTTHIGAQSTFTNSTINGAQWSALVGNAFGNTSYLSLQANVKISQWGD